MPTVFIPTQMRDLTSGVAQLSVEGESVREVIDALELQFPGIKQRLCLDDKLAPSLQISIDHVMSARGLRAKLKPESELHFLPVLGGG